MFACAEASLGESRSGTACVSEGDESKFAMINGVVLTAHDLLGVIRGVLKDGTEILRISLPQIYDYNAGEPILQNGKPVFTER